MAKSQQKYADLIIAVRKQAASHPDAVRADLMTRNYELAEYVRTRPTATRAEVDGRWAAVLAAVPAGSRPLAEEIERLRDQAAQKAPMWGAEDARLLYFAVVIGLGGSCR